mmetsp:Transcript_92769/g.276734  ORF Transcript_92769/g.276734 Transcript_92769/m.276734 type:complete len:275 (+) Transcript_92769:501-1325(+)
MEAHLGHPRLQRCEVRGVARQPSLGAALRLVLEQRLLEGQERVRGRREAELPVALHGLPLLQDVQRHAPRVRALPLETLPAAEDEAEARNALQVLVGRGDEVVDVGRLQVHGVGAEARHGVDDEADVPVKLAYGPADGLNGVQGARSRLVVDDPNVGIPAALAVPQPADDVLDGGAGRLVVLEHLIIHPVRLAHLGHADAVRAVGHHQDAASLGWRRHHAAHDTLHNEGAAALLQDAFEAGLFGDAGHPQEAVPHVLDDGHHGSVPGAEVAQHS